MRFVATSASRDARNAGEFVAGVREAFGDLDVAPEVVAGDTEARFSFSGATGDLQAVGVPGPYLVVDLGGGSTELVRGTTDVEAARSVDVGSVRMTERHLHSDPPTPDEVAAARRDVGPRSTRSRRPSTSPASARSSAWPARSRRSRRTRCGCRPTTPMPCTWRASRPT